VVDLQPIVAAHHISPTRRLIQRRSRAFCGCLTLALSVVVAFTILLVPAVLFYDGGLLAFGPGGIHFGPSREAIRDLLPLTRFTIAQRAIGAFAVLVLIGPVIVALAHLRALFRLYADGIVFAPANALHIKAVGLTLIVYSIAPLCANRAIWLAGVTVDPVWFHIDEIESLAVGSILFIIAKVMQFGREIEQERDGFV